MEIISISKFRITDSTSINGINELCKKTGKKPYEVIRDILHDYFSKDVSEAKNTSTAALDLETEESIKKTEVGVRILLKKLFDLSEDEYKELMKKNTKVKKDA